MENSKEKSDTQQFGETREKKWGFDLYPERKGEYKSKWTDFLVGRGTESVEKLKCEKRVIALFNRSPIIKLLNSALKASGCPIDLKRHISCEICDNSLLGGYDQELNQIVVCQNVCTSEGRVQNALAHEMVHMFDYCNNDIDFKNVDHLACAEIKAANLTSCSFLTSLTLRPSPDMFGVAKTHGECVKTKAVWSIKAARNLSDQEAKDAVDRNFEKCYNDLEPIGRRPMRNSNDLYKAYRERFLYGYG